MIAWSRRQTLIAGAALIVAVNALVLAGVAYNRSGDPTSTLQLSERELRHGRLSSKENSGVALSLVWRVRRGDDAPDADVGSYGWATDWLDQAKLAALGFDVASARAERESKLWRSKEVLLVLEFDGPAYRQTLARVQQKADEEEKLLLANPGNKEFERRAKRAREAAERDEREASRLFVVDAGLDAATLRAQYPDPTRTLIVRGQVRPQRVSRDRKDSLSGHISALSVAQINVPLEFLPALEQAAGADKKASFSATVAFGKRLEPWLVALIKKKNEKQANDDFLQKG